ncbi:PepSY-associated TM helix domain-containing protein [Rhizorhapis sp. SPR117]|uniref:PepSY-associated TM helix domain-containing protein n=1 Tax=Rhizorhapis sp. SPR117 TaxID=2912611 RepID=UPI001F16384E|nr:PepSY domain-containing protein [Rhizorhapis sp. SPR117]
MLRPVLLKIHRYCGLVAALFVLVQALSGIVLIYRGELARVIDPVGMVRQSNSGNAPLSDILIAVQRSYPEREIQRLAFPVAKDGVYFAHMADRTGNMIYTTVDPGSSKILSTGSIWHYPTEAALLVHYQLMSGKIGLAVVICTDLSILMMMTSGLLYWWPAKGRFAKSLTIRWNSSFRLLLRQVHRSTGIIVTIVIGTSALTGLAMAIAMMVTPGPLSQAPAKEMPSVNWGHADRALALAQARFPGAAVRDIRMPAPGLFNIFLFAPERNPEAVHTVALDLAKTQVLATTAAANDRHIWVPMLPIHDGKTFGEAGRALILLGGLSLVFLAITGPLMWYQGYRRQRRKTAPARCASDTP